MVVRSTPQALQQVDGRFKVVAPAGKGLLAVEAPRYAQFTDLLAKLSASPVQLVEISRNDDIFVTLLLPPQAPVPGPGAHLLTTALDVPSGWRRVGVSTKVADLLDVIRQARSAGGRVEHVYDY